MFHSMVAAKPRARPHPAAGTNRQPPAQFPARAKAVSLSLSLSLFFFEKIQKSGACPGETVAKGYLSTAARYSRLVLSLL